MDLTDLPSDILFQVLSECDVPDILSLSSTCKQLQQMADEHQVWLHQTRRLQIPIPRGTTPSRTELKEWTISRSRVETCWVKRRPGNLVLHLFDKGIDFVDAHLIPGGEFIVLLYTNGDVSLNRIGRSEATGDLDLREVARYEETNEADYPRYWSRLLTETSYGCPMLVWVGAVEWENPSVFLIDPVSQAIEKQHYVQCDFSGPEYFDVHKILAIKDRVFFACESMAGMQITLVAGSGPGKIMRRFLLDLPENDDGYFSDERFLLISDNGLVVSHPHGIRLYHIPEPGTVDDGFILVPVWSWESLLGDPSGYRGTLYKTASTYPALWLQGGRTAHTLEFDVDESGSFPMIVNHRITEGRPAYYVEGCFKLKGRKAMGVDVKERGKIVFKTGVLGKPDLTRQLHASLPGIYDGSWFVQDEVKYADLDEVTGRIMIVIGTVSNQRRDNIPFARRLCLADLPI